LKRQETHFSHVLIFLLQEQAIKEKQVSGRVQIQVWYRDDTNELVVNLLAADDLALRDEGRKNINFI
jgi:hypothetical protein